MSKFRRLSLDEARDVFPLLNEEAKKALKGGCGQCAGWEESYPGIPIHTEVEYNQQCDAGTWTGGLVCGIGYVLPEAFAYGEYTGYVEYCDIHWIEMLYGYCNECYFGQYEYCGEHFQYFGRFETCGYCYSNEGYYSLYYDNDYNDGSGSDSSGDGGSSGGEGNPDIGGGTGGPGGSGAGGSGTDSGMVVDLKSRVADQFVRSEEIPGSNYSAGTCVFDCIAQVLQTFGQSATTGSVMKDCSEILSKNILGLFMTGVNAEEYRTVLSNYFMMDATNQVKDIDSNLFYGNPVIGYMNSSNGEAHCIVILDINVKTGQCSYYDPLCPQEHKMTNLSQIKDTYALRKRP